MMSISARQNPAAEVRRYSSYRFLSDIERLPAQPQVNEGGLDELGLGYYGVGSIEELHQGTGVHQLFIFTAASEQEQGDAHEILGNILDAGIDPDIVLLRVGQAALQQEMANQSMID
jgi:hypothetical protein